MKNNFYLPTIALCFLMVFAITNINAMCPPSGEKADANIENADGKSETFRFVSLDMSVSDMTCMGCENKVKAALGTIDGVVATNKVDAETDIASISFDPTMTNEEEIAVRLAEKTGYNVAVIKSAAMDAGHKDCDKACCANKEGKKCTAAEKAACDKAKAEKLDKENIQAE